MRGLIRGFLVAVFALAAAGCGGGFNADKVLAFVDKADRAYLEGRGSEICEMRARDFKLTSVSFQLAPGQIVSGLEEAEAIEAEKNESGKRLEGKRETLNLQEFCFIALEQQRFFKRASMERSRIDIKMREDGKSAEVRAHYVIREPLLAAGESSLSYQDQVEHQVATMQTESDDVSVITTDQYGELVFASTDTVNKTYQIAKERDSRL